MYSKRFLSLNFLYLNTPALACENTDELAKTKATALQQGILKGVEIDYLIAMQLQDQLNKKTKSRPAPLSKLLHTRIKSYSRANDDALSDSALSDDEFFTVERR